MNSSNYWNDYYEESTAVAAPKVPSQFAAFVISELKGIETNIVDVGCGNGRDSLFFARHGFDVVGIDGSVTAIENCMSEPAANAHFLCASVTDPNLASRIIDEFQETPQDITVYARFFIHAIDDETQEQFLNTCRSLVGENGRVALEFRTDRDQMQTKITPEHYRRYVNPLKFIEYANKTGLKASYFVEGFGYAKYRDDDAHVARFILEPSK